MNLRHEFGNILNAALEAFMLPNLLLVSNNFFTVSGIEQTVNSNLLNFDKPVLYRRYT